MCGNSPGKGVGSETFQVQGLNELIECEATCDTGKIHTVSQKAGERCFTLTRPVSITILQSEHLLLP